MDCIVDMHLKVISFYLFSSRGQHILRDPSLAEFIHE